MKGVCPMNRYETNLVKKARGGDEQAFNDLYQYYYKQAYYFALKITNCDADAQDAVQESFITIKHSLGDLREVESFRKWMLQIVLSKCNKIFRKNKYAIWDPDVVNAFPVEEERAYMSGDKHCERLSRHEWLSKMIAQLTLHQREILVLMYFQQLSIKEIGEILNIPEGTVKSRLVSAKAALKRRIDVSGEAHQFRMWTPLPLLIALAYQKEYQGLMKVHFKVSYMNCLRGGTQGMAWMVGCTTVALVGGYGAHQLYTQSQNMPEHALYSDEGGTYSQKELYYLLREWAHCHIEMKQKSKEEFEVVLPYYQFLKDQNSRYYQRLERYNHWAQDFECYQK